MPSLFSSLSHLTYTNSIDVKFYLHVMYIWSRFAVPLLWQEKISCNFPQSIDWKMRWKDRFINPDCLHMMESSLSEYHSHSYCDDGDDVHWLEELRNIDSIFLTMWRFFLCDVSFPVLFFSFVIRSLFYSPHLHPAICVRMIEEIRDSNGKDSLIERGDESITCTIHTCKIFFLRLMVSFVLSVLLSFPSLNTLTGFPSSPPFSQTFTSLLLLSVIRFPLTDSFFWFLIVIFLYSLYNTKGEMKTKTIDDGTDDVPMSMSLSPFYDTWDEREYPWGQNKTRQFSMKMSADNRCKRFSLPLDSSLLFRVLVLLCDMSSYFSLPFHVSCWWWWRASCWYVYPESIECKLRER